MNDKNQEELMQEHVKNQQEVMRQIVRENQHLLDERLEEVKVPGHMTFGIAFVFGTLGGDFTFPGDIGINFTGYFGGIGIGGASLWGDATFLVPVEELLQGGVAFTAVEISGPPSLIRVDFSRNFKALGNFIGAGVGIGHAAIFGGGNFWRHHGT